MFWNNHSCTLPINIVTSLRIHFSSFSGVVYCQVQAVSRERTDLLNATLYQ